MSVLGGQYGKLESKCSIALDSQDNGTYELPAAGNYIPLPELLQEEPVQKKCKVYSLSRSLADDIGIVPALILKFIAYKVYSVRHQKDGRLWYYETYREIAKRFPFLSPSTVYRAIEKLADEKHHLLVIGNHNHRKYDKTRWFSVTEETRNRVDKDLIYFDPRDANAVGLKAAIVFYHLNYIFEKRKHLLKDGKWLKVWPADLEAYQPLSKVEAHHALAYLVSIGYLVKDKSHPNSCLYRLGDFDDDFQSSHLEQTPINVEQDPYENGADLPQYGATIPIRSIGTDSIPVLERSFAFLQKDRKAGITNE